MVPGTLAFVDNTGAAIAYTTAGTDLTRNGYGAGVQRLRAHFRILKAERSGGRARPPQVWNIDVTLTISRSGETHTTGSVCIRAVFNPRVVDEERGGTTTGMLWVIRRFEVLGDTSGALRRV